MDRKRRVVLAKILAGHFDVLLLDEPTYGYDADYTGFLELKAAREERELATERKRQSILRMELEWAKRGCRARTTKQKARLERLEELKMEKHR